MGDRIWPFAPLGLGDEDSSIDPATDPDRDSDHRRQVRGIIVTEFRQDDNGNWIPLGKVIRDFTIDVVPCEVLLPEVLWPEPCSGLDLSFDVDADEGAFLEFGTVSLKTRVAQAPSHSFMEPGIYPVSLVYDLGGCADSLSIDLAVSPPFPRTLPSVRSPVPLMPGPNRSLCRG